MRMRCIGALLRRQILLALLAALIPPGGAVDAAPIRTPVPPGLAAAPGDSCSTFSQAARWVSIAAVGGLPPARRDAAMVYDQERNRLILFGGRSGAAVLDDTWAFDLATRTWQAIAAGNSPRPPARFSMVAGVDRARQRLLITTGQAGTGQFFDDVWSLDLKTDTWSHVVVQGQRPPARYGSAGGIAHSGGDALYLSHGFTDNGRFDDIWAFNLATNTWQQITPAGQVPLRRCLHAAAVPGPDTLVLFGGCASGFGPCPLDDTWQFDRVAGAWTRLGATGGPAARQFPALVALENCGSLLLFGGLAGSASLNDLWRLSVDGAWAQVRPAGSPPAPRHSHSMAWVDGLGGAAGGVLVFGGQGAGGSLNDLWALLPGESPPAPGSLFLPLVQAG